jgi:hypothetical protein
VFSRFVNVVTVVFDIPIDATEIFVFMRVKCLVRRGTPYFYYVTVKRLELLGAL